MEAREYDLIVVGAAGFTGKLVVEEIMRRDHLLRDAMGRRRWAVSGRNRQRTITGLTDLPGTLPDVIAADLSDAASLPELSSRTSTIINVAGPFTPTARNLIAACIQTGTSYIDLSGEIPLLKGVICDFHDAAVAARVRIVQMAGWEALPADLTTLLASRRAVADPSIADAVMEEGVGAGDPITNVLVTARFSRKPDGKLSVSQAVSAGTLSSIVQMLESPKADLIARPDALLPPGIRFDCSPASLRLRPFTSEGRLLAPFAPVAFLNAPIVHRSAVLRAFERSAEYRPARYLEGDDMGKTSGASMIPRFGAAVLRTSLQRLVIAIAHAPTAMRTLIAGRLRKTVPEAGTGPTGRFLSDWEWSVRAQVSTADGRTGEAQLDGRGHPGYTATAAMIAEVGLRIALGRVPDRFGCLTPALAIGSLDLDPWFVDSLRLR